MTKLFTMKSLAFAGAAAFALTLAAAPQANAAGEKDTSGIKEFRGKVSQLEVIVENNAEQMETPDGKVIYYQVVNTGNEAKNGKFTAMAEEGLGYYNFSKYAGKEKTLYISLDGTVENSTSVAIVAAPKLKASYNVTDGLKIQINGTDASQIVSYPAIASTTLSKDEEKYFGDTGPLKDKRDTVVVAIVEGKEYVIEGVAPKIIKSMSVLGGTLELTASEGIENENTSSALNALTSKSKIAKLKIAGKPKAPKVSLKLNVKKPFVWKVAANQEYMVQVREDKNTVIDGEWVTGSGTDASWSDIISASKAEWGDAVTGIVTGDAITKDITLNVRKTASNGKPASIINVIKLNKSADSPTKSSIAVVTYKQSGKIATGASIIALKKVQYFDSNTGNWKDLNTSKVLKLKDTQKELLVRTPGVSSKGNYQLPSLNTHITIDFEKGTAEVVALKVNNKGVAEVANSDENATYTVAKASERVKIK